LIKGVHNVNLYTAAGVCLDSSRCEFFNPQVQQIVPGTCAGIAAFTDEVY
jgi:hypothetical protein